MEIYAGIDGGGTGTTLRVESVDRTYVEEYRFGAFNINSIGRERFVRRLEEIFTQVKECGTCTTLCIGAAGISNQETRSILEENVKKWLPYTKLKLMGDHEIALYGATKGDIGAILIAGTGSICSGILESGAIVRAGGYGHLIDDLGSGYSIGKDALYAIMCGEDGRGEETILTDLIKKQLKVTTIIEIVKVVHEASDKSVVASLSRQVEEAAKQGDSVASSILEQNAHHLLELVKAVCKKIVESKQSSQEEGIPLVLMGGMIANDTRLKEILLRKIALEVPYVVVKTSLLNAVEGAVLVAKA
ncbi:MAG: BadF/BadG/BcrA/BcrD ATPase family protein [Eubacteriales bacterium]